MSCEYLYRLKGVPPSYIIYRFWEIAIPLMVVVVPLFLWSDFRRIAHYFEERLAGHKIKKVRFCRGSGRAQAICVMLINDGFRRSSERSSEIGRGTLCVEYSS